MSDTDTDIGLEPVADLTDASSAAEAHPLGLTEVDPDAAPEEGTEVIQVFRDLPTSGPGSVDYFVEQIGRIFPEYTEDQVFEHARKAAFSRLQVAPGPERAQYAQELSLLERAERLDLTEYARRLSTSSTDTPVETIIQQMAEEQGVQPDEYMAFAQAAGYNLEGMAHDIRVRGQNPNAVIRLSSIRGEPGFASNALTAEEQVERTTLQTDLEEARESGDIETLMDMDDTRIEILRDGQERARVASYGSRPFTQAEQYATQLLANPDMNRVYRDASNITSTAATQRYAEQAVEVYLNRFGISPGDSNYSEARDYFYLQAVKDISMLITTGRWPGNRQLTQQLMARLTGDHGMVTFMDVSGLPRAWGGNGTRMEIVGMSADGYPLLANVPDMVAVGEFIDKPISYWSGVTRGFVQGDITDLESFSEAGLRGMGDADNFMQLSLDQIGDNPEWGATRQVATYLAGTSAYVLSGDMLVMVGGLLGKGVRATYRGVKLRPIREANELVERAARARLQGNWTEAAEVEAMLRARLGARESGIDNLAAQIDADDARIAQRFHERGVDGA